MCVFMLDKYMGAFSINHVYTWIYIFDVFMLDVHVCFFQRCVCVCVGVRYLYLGSPRLQLSLEAEPEAGVLSMMDWRAFSEERE